MSFPPFISALKLNVSMGMSPNVQTFEQDIHPSDLSGTTTNSVLITNSDLLNAFNNQPPGTIFNPSIVATYQHPLYPSGNEVSNPSASNYVPKKITPSISLADIPDKLTTDASFSIASLVSKEGTGVLSYSSSNTSVATINSSTGQVTIVGAGTTTITVSLAASADGIWAAATPVSKNLIVYPNWIQRGSTIYGVNSGDESGRSVSLSADGSIVAIGGSFNNGTSGHVRVYERNGSGWVQRGSTIYGDNINDRCGWSVSLSADGSIVAIGAFGNDNNGSNSGHVRVYQYDANKTTPETNQSLSNFGPIGWNRLGNDIDGENIGDESGRSVSLSADGSILAIGAPFNDSNSINSGHVKVYAWNGSSWVQRGTNIDGNNNDDRSGWSVSLSADGSVLAIGAVGNNSYAGNVRVYERNGSSWVQRGSSIDGENSDDRSGWSVSLSADGSIVAIGAFGNDSNGSNSGHVRVYQYDANKTTAQPDQSLPNFGPIGWNRLGNDIDGENSGDESGRSVSLSADGSILAIGAPFNDSNSINSGHVKVYAWNGSSWVQRGTNIDGNNNDVRSGWSVSLSADGSVLAIGAVGNNSYAGNVIVYEFK